MNNIIASALGILSGAVVTPQPDGSIVIHSSPGRYVAWTLVFIFVATGSFVMWRKRIQREFSLALFIASFTIPGLVIPGMMTDKVLVSREHVVTSTGFWFAPMQTEMPLAGLSCIREERKIVQSGRSWREKIIWQFEWEDGRRAELNLSDLFADNRDVVANYLRVHGVRVLT